MNWMAPYGKILTIIAPLPLYKPRKPSFCGTALRVANTPKDNRTVVSLVRNRHRFAKRAWHVRPAADVYPDVCNGGSGLEAESWFCPEEQWLFWRNILLHLQRADTWKQNRSESEQLDKLLFKEPSVHRAKTPLCGWVSSNTTVKTHNLPSMVNINKW